MGQASEVSGTPRKAGIQGGEGIIEEGQAWGEGQPGLRGWGTGEERAKPGTCQRGRDGQNGRGKELGPEAECQVKAFQTECFTSRAVFLERDLGV